MARVLRVTRGREGVFFIPGLRERGAPLDFHQTTFRPARGPSERGEG